MWLLLASCFVAEAASAVPRFTTTPPTNAEQGSTYSYEIRTADNQRGWRLVSAPVLPAWLRLANVSLNNGRAVLTGTPSSVQTGQHAVTLQVMNLTTFATATQSFTINVVGPNVPPVITGQTPSPIPLAQGESLTIELTHLLVSDADDPYPVGFSLTVLNGSNYSRSGTTIQPASNFTGTLNVPVHVNDGDANSNTFTLQIAVSSANRPPEIVAPIPSQLGAENQPFVLRNASGQPTTLAAFFRDPNSTDQLFYEVVGLPAGLTANASTGAITGTPQASDARDTPYVVSVTANDGTTPSNALPTQTFALTIAAFDRADISLRLDVTASPSLTGTDVVWQFTVANAGPQAAAAVDLATELAGNPLRFAGSPACTVTDTSGGQRLDCDVGALAAGASTVVTLTAQAPAAGDVSATAQASAGTTPRDPNPVNNAVTTTLHVAEILSAGPAQAVSGGRGAAAGDVNGDGFADLVLARGAGESAEVYLNVVDAANSAKRTLAAAAATIAGTNAATQVALADLDGDDDLDLVTASSAAEGNAAFRNDGNGGFVSFATLGSGRSNAIAASDLDRDGFVDLVFANDGPSSVLLNRSGSTFASGAALGSGNHRGVVAVDLDLDSLPDLVFAHADGPSRFYRNLGGGAFAAGVVVDTEGAEGVASGDFNGDGRPDLVFARAKSPSGVPANPVYRNDPGAGGVPVLQRIAGLGAAPTVAIFATDIDYDGAVDVIALNATGTHQVYLGDGAGAFALHPVQFSSAGVNGAALGTFSVDTRLDLAVVGSAASAAFFNDGRGGFGAGDTLPPAIALVGDSLMTVTVGSAYVEPGATATDDVDGSLTAEIDVQGTVNTAIVGDYAVTYDVADSSGNAATQAKRTVRVAPNAGTGGGGGGAVDGWVVVLMLLAFGTLRLRKPERFAAH